MAPFSHTDPRLLRRLEQSELPEALSGITADVSRFRMLYVRVLLRAARAMYDGASRVETLLCDVLPGMADPEAVLLQLDRFLETTFSPAGILEDFSRYPWHLEMFGTLTEASGYVADVLVRDPELFRWLATSGVLDETRDREEMLRAARESASRFATQPKRVKALRRFQRRELLRIAAADLMHRITMEQATRMLSDLADAVLDVLLVEARQLVEARRGAAFEAPLAILALGKLGGRELNYSSDIDLMAVYGAPPPESAADAQDVAADIVKELIRLLTEPGTEGMFYRTDFRLRPDGAAGALTRSLAATLSYYEDRGAPWERQMLIKARPAAGDTDFGAAVLERLRPFVYPRHNAVPPSVMLRDISARLRERWVREDDVKHFCGGIRHVEFSVQALQLLHGGSSAQLRAAGTLDAIGRLHREGVLRESEADVLTRGYVFLRRVEHLLQLDRFEQTHTLPRAGGMDRLARLMKYPDAGAFEEKLQEHRIGIMRVCDDILLGGGEDAATAAEMLSGAMFTDPDTASRLLHEIRDGREGRQHDHAATRLAEQALPLIAADAAEEALPMHALRSIEMLVNRSGHPAAVFGYLREQGPRRFLLRVGALAPVALRDITVDPLVLDAVFSGRAGEFSPLSDARRLKRAVEIDALGRLLLDSSDIAEYGRDLSYVADELVHAAWLLATGKADAPFLVLAMGKYGGEELTPGSDLDVVFLYQADRLGSEEAQSMAREFIRVLQAAGGADMLYTVDARLRPEGRSAPLAVSLDAYRQYFASRASLWERQSLLRARVVAGPPSMAAEVNGVIAGALDAVPVTTATWREIESMRGRMEPVNRFGRDDFFDLKLSPGGLVDAEFAAQLLMLAAGRELRTANTFHALALAGSVTGRLERSFGEMDEDYRFLRTLQLRLRLLADLPGNLVPADDRELDTLARSMRCANADAFRAELRQRSERLRRNFTGVIEHLSSPPSRI